MELHSPKMDTSIRSRRWERGILAPDLLWRSKELAQRLGLRWGWEGGQCGKVSQWRVHLTPPRKAFLSLLPSGSRNDVYQAEVSTQGLQAQVTSALLDTPDGAKQEFEVHGQNNWLTFCPSPEQHHPSGCIRVPAAPPRDGPLCGAHKISLAKAWIPPPTADKPHGVTTLSLPLPNYKHSKWICIFLEPLGIGRKNFSSWCSALGGKDFTPCATALARTPKCRNMTWHKE